ncbi:hypothetical protein ACLOJK_035582 [Asimina triloba]
MDEKVTEMELKQEILLSAASNKLSMTQEQAEEYAALIMEELDCENRGYVEVSQLETLFKAISGSDRVDHFSTLLSRNSRPLYREWFSWISILFQTYWRHAWIIGLWLLTCLLLFSWKFMQYRHRSAYKIMGYCVCTAKGAAETLKFNMALIILPMCRNTMTWLRKHYSVNSIIPFNDNINFHKLIAGGIAVGIIIHGVTHLACDFPRITSADLVIFQQTIATGFPQHQQPTYNQLLATTEVVTGIFMTVLIAVAFSLATSSVRRHSATLPWPLRQFMGYNAFWCSHHLFIAVYALLVVHSIFLFLTKNITEKTTWMYIAVPVLLYSGERAMRARFSSVEVLEARIYPGKVTSLKLSKPSGFKYRSGMYMLIQCPRVSTWEWHPFSFTSAPDDEYLGIHIRTVGDWSHQIYSLFQEALVSESSDLPTLLINGPYGAASQDHVKYDVVVMIGLGIGATPFISILKDIAHGLNKLPLNAGNDEESGIGRGPSKAYFYWEVIEMHNYLTSIYREGDMRSALISAIQALQHAKNGVDIISRTLVQTHFGRPNWFNLFSKLATTNEGRRIGKSF